MLFTCLGNNFIFGLPLFLVVLFCYICVCFNVCHVLLVPENKNDYYYYYY